MRTWPSPHFARSSALLTGLALCIPNDTNATAPQSGGWATSVQCEVDVPPSPLSRWGGTLSATFARLGCLTLRPCVDFDLRSEESDQTVVPMPLDWINTRTTDDRQSLYVSLGLRTPPPHGGTKFLAGIGPMAGYSHTKWTREALSQTYHSVVDPDGLRDINWYALDGSFDAREESSWILGLRGEAGVEFVVSGRLAIIAEIVLWPQYWWRRVESTSADGPPGLRASQSVRTSDRGAALETTSKVGVSIRI